MSFPLFGTAGSLFNCLGKMGAVVADVNSLQATINTAISSQVTGVLGQLSNFPTVAAPIGSSYIGWLGSLEQPSTAMQASAQAFINAIVYNNQPQIAQSLTQQNLAASINYILQQMSAQSATVLQMTVAGSSSSGNSINNFIGQGNGIIGISLKRPFDGRFLENAFAETITYTCTSDSYTGGSKPFNERFTITGQGSQPDVFAYNWPLGSNGQITFNAINGDANNSQGNLLTNSGFANWTGSVPNNWILVTGSNISQNGTILFKTGSSLQITGDSSTLTSLTQTLNSGSGSSGKLTAQTQYSANVWIRCGGSTPATGILTIDLIDQNGVVIKDVAGNNNSYSITLSGLTTNWTPYIGYFRLPEQMPTGYSFRLHLTQALNTGAVVYVDTVSLGVMQQLYVQGPFVSVHSGSNRFVASPVADYATAGVTNSRGAGGTLSTWQTLMYRLVPLMASSEVLLPSSLSPNVSDGLIA